MRTTEEIFGKEDSILKDEPSVHTLPDGPESESPSADPAAEPAAETTSEGETPKPAVEAKASTKPNAVKAKDDDEDEEENDPVDQSLDGLKKALTAVRGDKRKMRKQWREAEKRAEEHARRLAQLEGQLTAYQQLNQRQPEQPKKEEPPKLPDFFGDPEQHLSEREKRILSQWEQREKALRDEFSQAQFKRDAERSERRMRREHEDYEQMKALVRQTHDERSSFWVQMMSDPEPAELVYEEGRRLSRGGKSEREAQLEAEIEALKAEKANSSETTVTKSKPPAQPIPKSIAAVRGTGNGVTNAWKGPRSAKELYD